jgi:hypothetical protein
MLALCALFSTLWATPAAVASPILVYYWDGANLDALGPGSSYVIPAGAVYALDEVPGTGVEVVLSSLPGLPAPDPGAVPGPNVSVPSITTPSGTTIEIPDAGNVSSITQNGGSVTVTYNDGATATVPGTYVPPGSALPAPPPANQPVGPPAPPLNPAVQNDVDNSLIDDAWVQDFLGGELEPEADFFPPVPQGSNVPFNSFFDVYVDLYLGQADTIVQRATGPTPESGTGVYLLLGAAACFGTILFGRMKRRMA